MDNVIILDAISNSTNETINAVNNVSRNVTSVAGLVVDARDDISNVSNNQQKVWLVQPSDTTIYSADVLYRSNSEHIYEFYLSFPENYRITGATSVSNPKSYNGNASLQSYITNGDWKTDIDTIVPSTNQIIYLKNGWHRVYKRQTVNKDSWYGVLVEIKGTLTLDDISNYPLCFH